MGKRLYSNLASTTLSASISSTDLSLTVSDPSNFPTIASGSGDYFIVTLSDTLGNFEFVKIIGISGASMTIDPAGRGLEGTTARSWNAGDFVELCATAGSFDDKADKVVPATINNIAVLDSTGNLADSGTKVKYVFCAGGYSFNTDSSKVVYHNAFNTDYVFGTVTLSYAGSVCPVSGILKNLRVRVGQNTSDAAATFTIYKNSTATSLYVTVPAGDTTVVSNTSDTVNVLVGDLLVIAFDGRSVSSGVVNNISWSLEIEV